MDTGLRQRTSLILGRTRDAQHALCEARARVAGRLPPVVGQRVDDQCAAEDLLGPQLGHPVSLHDNAASVVGRRQVTDIPLVPHRATRQPVYDALGVVVPARGLAVVRRHVAKLVHVPPVDGAGREEAGDVGVDEDALGAVAVAGGRDGDRPVHAVAGGGGQHADERRLWFGAVRVGGGGGEGDDHNGAERRRQPGQHLAGTGWRRGGARGALLREEGSLGGREESTLGGWEEGGRGVVRSPGWCGGWSSM